MNIKRIRVIIEKEWIEVFKNRMVVFTTAFMPILFIVLPIGMLSLMNSSMSTASASQLADVPPQFLEFCGNLPGTDCMQIYMMNIFMMMFMMMPLMIPTAIAAYSIVGEKTTRSLEPLLATPITTLELLTGKALAASIPAIIAGWASYFIFLILLPLAGGTPGLIRHAVGPIWLLAILVVGPLMAIAAVNLAVIVSARVNDPRVAEQVAGVLIVPVMLVLFGQLGGLIILNEGTILISIVVITLLDIGLIIAGARLFQRETILTQWK